MTTDFQARAHSHVNELRATPDIVMTACEIGSGPPRELSADDAALIGSAWGDTAVEGVREYLLSTDHIHVAWHMDDYSLDGEFFLKDVRNCLSGRVVPYVDVSLSPEQRELMADGLLMLEEAPGSGRLTALRHHAPSQGLWFYDTNHRNLVPLELDYRSYVDTLLVMKGIPGWQYLFTDVDLRHGKYHATVRQLEKTLEGFPDLFPDHDYSHLRERFQARCDRPTRGRARRAR
ncbi:hypothetical protein [Actinoallomurus sp. NPDC050550]|uniref:hypothetical protein n=1 Tax=Actinoallomurus sp. NPDC050550 TaxID=3154937 RepID=UPI003406B2C0